MKRKSHRIDFTLTTAMFLTCNNHKQYHSKFSSVVIIAFRCCAHPLSTNLKFGFKDFTNYPIRRGCRTAEWKLLTNNLRSHLMKSTVIRFVVCDLILSTNFPLHTCALRYITFNSILFTFYLLTAYFISQNIVQRNAFRYLFSSLLF